MKRKASLSAGGAMPTKLSKKATNDKLSERLASVKRGATIEPVRSASFRQRKAPSWLASYVTNSSQEKEVKQGAVATEKPKLKMPRFPTLVPPSKRGNEEKKTEPAPTLLRKKSTLKLDASSPPASSTKNKQKPPLVPTPSLSRKPTKIIRRSSSDSSSGKDANSKPALKVKKKSSSGKDLSSSLMKRDKLKVTKTSKRLSSSRSSTSSTSPSKPGKKRPISRGLSSSLKKIKEDTIPDSKVVELCDDPLNASTLPLSDEENEKENDTDNVSNCSDVTPILKEDESSNFKLPAKTKTSPKSNNSQAIPRKSSPPPPPLPYTHNKSLDQTILLPDQTQRPSMLEVVICISTSGALREYLQALQENIREIIWRLQSLVSNLRIGVMTHTQGGIHDDPSRGSFSAGDHNYNRAGGHSGTKWLDLGATLSQICAFVDSLESEPTVYPDYVQDNLEMALWKLQRCMSWSSCSYRAVVMLGRGRPNRTTFYHQKEHWRGWIRSALELPLCVDIPVIDWELEAKLLAQMGIHVFTIQAMSPDKTSGSSQGTEDEGTCFFRRVAEITQSQHVRIVDASKLPEIIIGICCACHGSELFLDHRDTVRDENDGVLPTQLTEVFVGLQLHSKSSSLTSSLPSMLRNLDLSSVRQQLNGYGSSRMERSMEVNSVDSCCMDYNSLRIENSMETEPAVEKMETKMSRAKTIRKMKTVRGGRGSGDQNRNKNSVGNKGKASDKKSVRVNGVGNNKRGNTNTSNTGSIQKKSSAKPYEVGRKRSEVAKSKGAAGGVVDKVKVLDAKAKAIARNSGGGGRRGRDSQQSNGNGLLVNGGLNQRPSGKRQIKLSPKVKEHLLSVKKGGLVKAKDRNRKSSPVFTELKKKAVQSILSASGSGSRQGRLSASGSGSRQGRLSASGSGSRQGRLSASGSGSRQGRLSAAGSGSRQGRLSAAGSGSRQGRLSASGSGSRQGRLSAAGSGSRQGRLSAAGSGSRQGRLSAAGSGSRQGRLSASGSGSRQGRLSAAGSGSRQGRLSAAGSGSRQGRLSASGSGSRQGRLSASGSGSRQGRLSASGSGSRQGRLSASGSGSRQGRLSAAGSGSRQGRLSAAGSGSRQGRLSAAGSGSRQGRLSAAGSGSRQGRLSASASNGDATPSQARGRGLTRGDNSHSNRNQNGSGKRKPPMVNGSGGGEGSGIGKRQKKNEMMARKKEKLNNTSKVSPLNRRSSAGKSSIVKSVLGSSSSRRQAARGLSLRQKSQKS